jgi:hypothetical protein
VIGDVSGGTEKDHEKAVLKARERGDSVGGVVGCSVEGLPPKGLVLRQITRNLNRLPRRFVRHLRRNLCEEALLLTGRSLLRRLASILL